MSKDEFEEKTEEFERKFKEYQEFLSVIPACVERGHFRSAVAQFVYAEQLFSDGLFEELHYLADQSENIDPPESDMDIIKDSDAFRVGE